MFAVQDMAGVIDTFICKPHYIITVMLIITLFVLALRPSTSPTSSGRQQLVATERRLQQISSEPAEGPTVSYYWGVPFCPRGLDPDKYTQVKICLKKKKE